MAERVFLVHGWSVKDTTTYQALHRQLAANGFHLHDVQLGRYVTLDDHVEIRDISRALHAALERELGPTPWTEPFHVVTHSTGAMVVKHWIAHHYVGAFADAQPLANVVFLAGPHFGSRLAHHGRSMLAHVAFRGETGHKVLEALELGSALSWDLGDLWLDEVRWKKKGVRPFCLIGDRVPRGLDDRLKARIFPAYFEEGSDQVIRVPAGNLNFRRYEIDLCTGRRRRVGEVSGVPFGALWRYTHSGSDTGIMNSIRKRSRPDRHQALGLILECLRVTGAQTYARARTRLAEATAETRGKRDAFAQLDFRFRDEDGRPVTDYKVVLGYVDADGRARPSGCVVHTHKNRVTPEHFTAFVRLKDLERGVPFFFEFTADTDTPLVGLTGGRQAIASGEIDAVVRADETTQVDVIVGRHASPKLFVFHSGDDPDLHVAWDREGNVTDTGLAWK